MSERYLDYTWSGMDDFDDDDEINGGDEDDEHEFGCCFPDRCLSQHPGVHWHYKGQKWRVTISVKNKTRHVGFFSTEEEAVEARKAAIVELREAA